MGYILWQNNHCITTKDFCWLLQSNVYNKKLLFCTTIFVCTFFLTKNDDYLARTGSIVSFG
jgi:hypothetical protein